MLTETKEMLDAAYDSAMSQSSIHDWHDEFKSRRKSAEFMGGPDAPMTAFN